MDGCDTWYLNYSYQPVVNPLYQSLDIMMYYPTLFSFLPLTLPPKFIYTPKILQYSSQQSSKEFSPVSSLRKESGT